MSYQRSNGNGCAHFIVGLAILYVVSSLLHEWFVRRTRIRIQPIAFFILILVALVTVGLMVYQIIRLVSHVSEQRRLKAAICPHGMAGGATLSLCLACKAAAEEARREAELQIALAERRKQIEQQWRALLEQQIEVFEQTNLKSHGYLLNLTPQRFEDAICKLYRALGYSVYQTPYANDGGRDAIATKGKRKYSIECKRYARDRAVGRPELQKFYAAILEDGSHQGLFITTGRFSKAAVAYAKKVDIQLIDGDNLMSLMSQAFPSASTVYKVMCRECGEILKFPADVGACSRTCKSGHQTRNPFADSTLDELRALISKRSPAKYVRGTK